MKIRKKGSNTKSIFVILFLLICGNCINQPPENDTEFHSKTSPKSYHVSMGVTVKNTRKMKWDWDSGGSGNVLVGNYINSKEI